MLIRQILMCGCVSFSSSASDAWHNQSNVMLMGRKFQAYRAVFQLPMVLSSYPLPLPTPLPTPPHPSPVEMGSGWYITHFPTFLLQMSFLLTPLVPSPSLIFPLSSTTVPASSMETSPQQTSGCWPDMWWHMEGEVTPIPQLADLRMLTRYMVAYGGWGDPFTLRGPSGILLDCTYGHAS